MSYSNVIGGKLNLKGKALDVKGGGAKKKKAKKKASLEQKLLMLQQSRSLTNEEDGSGYAEEGDRSPHGSDGVEDGERGHDGQAPRTYEDHRTPAEKVYDEQRNRLEMKRLGKVTSKSHRQKIEEFNQYLANLSEHYDIPKVGPG